MHSWQGVELAIRALAQVRQTIPASLTVIAPGDTGPLDKLAKKLQVQDCLSLLPAMSQSQLASQIRSSEIVLAPLALNDRNVLQGCCPLKVLEGMACGVPVIASDLPAVRELGRDGTHFLLVKPGSVDQTTEAILRLHSDPESARTIGANARRHIENYFTWERAGAQLIDIYEELIRSSTA
jgi:glycosyltransferase involved in cell wall biosynthesis